MNLQESLVEIVSAIQYSKRRRLAPAIQKLADHLGIKEDLITDLRSRPTYRMTKKGEPPIDTTLLNCAKICRVKPQKILYEISRTGFYHNAGLGAKLITVEKI